MAKSRTSGAPAEEQSTFRTIIETVVLVALAFLLAQGIKAFIVQPFKIPSGSMISTIDIGDRVLADKLTYRFRAPRRGDIVVVDDPTGVYPALIKRVIATGGEMVDLRDGSVYVDGKELSEPYTRGRPSYPQTIPMPVRVPQSSLWLMGDNRTGSTDSRTFGPVPVSAVQAHAFATYWPLTKMGALR